METMNALLIHLKQFLDTDGILTSTYVVSS